jgi:Zn-dependent protease
MGRGSRFNLLTVRGIPIGVDWSWFLVLFLVIWLLSGYYRDVFGDAQDSTTPYLLAVASALGFFGSILLHELGHAIVAQRNGVGISQITLWRFGGVATLEKEPPKPGIEFRVAAAGPAVTLLITVASLAAGSALAGGDFWEVSSFDEHADISKAVAVLAWIGNINAIILVFNLIPAFPMDGGRIALAIAWKLTNDRHRGTLFAARLGQVMAAVIIAVGILLILYGDAFSGIWLAFIGWMILNAARATAARTELNQRIGGLRVADVMDAEPVAIPADATVERALDEYFLRYRWPWFPVVDAAQRFLGLLNRGTADSVPEVSRASQRVDELLPGQGGSVGVDEPIESLLGNTELRRLGGLAAVDPDGKLIGVVTFEQIGRALRRAVEDDEAGAAPR